jgi:hypothetical protein
MPPAKFAALRRQHADDVMQPINNSIKETLNKPSHFSVTASN